MTKHRFTVDVESTVAKIKMDDGTWWTKIISPGTSCEEVIQEVADFRIISTKRVDE